MSLNRALPFLLALLLFACAEGKSSPDGPGQDTGESKEDADTSALEVDGSQEDLEASDSVDTSSDESEDIPVDQSAPYKGPLGKGCQVTSDCHRGSTSWPSCLSAQCDGGFCWLSFDGTGFCSHGCDDSSDCEADESSVVGESFGCDQTPSGEICLPGSNSLCEDDTSCPNGEVCKLGYANSTHHGVCQTAYEGGANPGEACNDDPNHGPVVSCANNLCIGKVCSAFCDPNGNTLQCGGNQSVYECFDDIRLSDSYSAPICYSKYCASDAECPAPDYSCAPPQLYDGSQVRGRCNYIAPDSAKGALNDTCNTNDDCQSGWCGFAVEDAHGGILQAGYCSVLCDGDQICADDQICAARVYGWSNVEQAVNLCTSAKGSRTSCTGNPECGAGEVCRIYLVGAPHESDPFVFTGMAQTLCAEPVYEDGAEVGESCEETPCQNDYCINIDGGPRFCTAPCVNNFDCPGTMRCHNFGLSIYHQNNSFPEDDIGVKVCVP